VATSEMKDQGWRAIGNQYRKASDILTSTLAAFFLQPPKNGKGSRDSSTPGLADMNRADCLLTYDKLG